MRKHLLLALCLPCLLPGCGREVVEWNGEIEYSTRVSMVVDETDLYEYVGAVDYVFAGTVDKVLKNVVSGRGEDVYSTYRLHVDQSLKGELPEYIECDKEGGLDKDGTMQLLSSDRSRDSGLPEEGKQYIFLAYAQPDGSLLLSEFFDNRPYDDALLREYQGYCGTLEPPSPAAEGTPPAAAEGGGAAAP